MIKYDADDLVKSDNWCRVQVRSMAAVLLRRIYTSSFEEFWPQFPPESQAQLKERTIVSIQGEPNAALRKKICECGAEFARNLLGECWQTVTSTGFNFSKFGSENENGEKGSVENAIVHNGTDTVVPLCAVVACFLIGHNQVPVMTHGSS